MSDRVIVFVCEHGAAKSIIAATYFNKFAKEKKLKLRAVARGTDPQQELSPKAIAGLRSDGLTPTESVPRKLLLEDALSAEKIISFGEALEEVQHDVVIEHWDDIPPVGKDYEKARDAILEKLKQLLK